jgi:hypothetical protein
MNDPTVPRLVPAAREESADEWWERVRNHPVVTALQSLCEAAAVVDAAEAPTQPPKGNGDE